MPKYDPLMPYQADDPTDEQRYAMLRYALLLNDRREDFDYILDILRPPPDITSIAPKKSGKNIKIAVMGAGEAGLSAAYELKKIGCDITIFEASNRIGGRIYTNYFDNERKYFGELGAMRIPVSHETTWHYINKFNLKTRPFVNKNINGLFYLRDSYAINDPGGISVQQNIYPKYNLSRDERNTPWQDLSGRMFNKYFYSLPPQIRKELIEIKPVYSQAIQNIDKLDLRSAYENAGLSQDAISMIGFLSAFENAFLKISLTEIFQEAYTEDLAFTYYINGGMINLPLAFYNSLSSKNGYGYAHIDSHDLGQVIFRMEWSVDGIYLSPDNKGIILECRDTNTFEITFERFDYIVCAIPFSSLRRVMAKPLFSVPKQQAISELNYEDSQKTLLFLKDRFWEAGDPYTRIVGGRSLTDLPNITVYYPSDHAMPIPGIVNGWTMRPNSSPQDPGVLYASYNWGQDSVRLGNEHIDLRVYDVKKYIEKIHGLPFGYIDKKMIASSSILWSKVQYIWGGACTTKPQDKLLFSYVVTLPEINDRVFFAGEHISQKHAWQQGSLKTGMLAANEIAKRINQRNP
ncbi:flavin-dependent L-tryptophan oxidase RebO precursor [Oxobacter pfennigii]|uniref:Flavin-dependent L-tryptophan oxidase RebO n=1 Tax=Oxobacter pfennigii TaxID=36849 RepID=A0A0N8NTE1_9CLOT|nr:FAD-dependent oxidoreductase [Oxobacter pfennigii]KPU44576.1 flavin-dependent L-tryptophan oxidase RebO precursor [Oxobacter pfennigii]